MDDSFVDLLIRQLERCKIEQGKPVTLEQFQEFVKLVNGSYISATKRQTTMERAIAISNEEIRTYLEQIRSAEEFNAKNSRMFAIGEMAGTISHEINNPLAIVRSYAEILHLKSKGGNLESEKAIQLTQKIMRACDRITRTVDSMKKLSRVVPSESVGSACVSTFIQDCLDLSAEHFKTKGIDLKVVLPPKNLMSQIHSSEAVQILLNLLSNAKDALEELDRSERWIKIDYELTEDKIVVSVENGGDQIPVDIQMRMFDSFFTTKKADKGTGIGLSISKKLATKYCCQLSFDGSGKHPRFLFTLPIEKTDQSEQSA